MKIKHLIILTILFVILAGMIDIVAQYQKKDSTNTKIPILLYHDFKIIVPDSDPDNFNYINTPQSFDENMKTLLENQYTFISFQELYDALNGEFDLPSKPILITMDDGYYSNYELVYPILKKYNLKASIFIVTDNIGKEINEKKYLTWEQCIEMQNSGLVEIFSHSKKHVFYNRFPGKEIYYDVKESYKNIEKFIGRKTIKVFAYPYGASTNETVLILKLLGINMQVHDIGINYFSNFNKDYIKRINIPCEMTGAEIIEEINKTN